jgi:hypothetical protein
MATVCPHCRAKLGGIGKNGIAKKPTSFAVGCLAVFLGIGVLGAIGGSIAGGGTTTSKPAPPPEPVDPKYGIKPDVSVMQYLLSKQIPAGLHDPSSFQDLEVFEPVKDTITVKGKKVDCWRVGIQFRAKNGFGALRLQHGRIWMRDNNSIKEEISN